MSNKNNEKKAPANNAENTQPEENKTEETLAEENSAPAGNSQEKAEKKKMSLKVKLLIIAASIIVAFAALYVAFGIYINNLDTIFPNTYVNGVDVSGKTEAEAIELINESFAKEYGDKSFNVTVGDITKTVSAADLSVKVDAANSAKIAFARGRNGNFVTNPLRYIKSLFTDYTTSPTVILDTDSITKFAQEFTAANVLPVDASYVVEADKIVISPAVGGMVLNQTTLEDTLRYKFATLSYDDVTIELEPVSAKGIDIDAIYKEVHKEVVDAKIEVLDGKSVITPHVVGTTFDLEAAKAALAATPDAQVSIPLIFTQPKTKTLDVQATLFQDTLSTKTTYYSPAKVNRCANVRLAASLINGTILNPGEVFSYNKTVGPRTAARGFKAAAIFASGEVVDGLGGGICQVSSTLYMASMFADMKTVERKNHSFFVDYAPKGQDATVVYGSIDFKFQNTSPYPVKIVAYTTSNSVTVSIMGTKTQAKTVKIQSSTLGTTGYPTQTVVDPSLQPGQRVVKQKGQVGMTMDVYRYVYDANGNLISKSYENKTRYSPMPEIVNVGPEAAPTTPETPPTDVPATPTPETPTTPTTPVAPETPDVPENPAPPATDAPVVDTPAPEAPVETPAEPQPAEPETPAPSDTPVSENNSEPTI